METTMPTVPNMSMIPNGAGPILENLRLYMTVQLEKSKCLIFTWSNMLQRIMPSFNFRGLLDLAAAQLGIVKNKLRKITGDQTGSDSLTETFGTGTADAWTQTSSDNGLAFETGIEKVESSIQQNLSRDRQLNTGQHQAISQEDLQEKRELMEQFLENAIPPLKSQLDLSTRVWMYDNLSSPNNIEKMITVYDNVFKEILDTGRALVDSSLWEEMERRFLEGTKCSKKDLQEVVNCVTRYGCRIERKVADMHCFTPYELESIHTEEQDPFISKFYPDRKELLELVETGCHILMVRHFKPQNDRINEAVGDRALKLLNNLYVDEMKPHEMVPLDNFDPIKLKEMQSAILERLTLTFEETFPDGMYDRELNRRKAALTKDFELVLKSKEAEKSLKMKTALDKLLSQSKSSYQLKMRPLLKSLKESNDQNQNRGINIKRMHDKIVNEVMGIFQEKMKIHKPDEKMEKEYVQALQTHISSYYWENVLDTGKKIF